MLSISTHTRKFPICISNLKLSIFQEERETIRVRQWKRFRAAKGANQNTPNTKKISDCTLLYLSRFQSTKKQKKKYPKNIQQRIELTEVTDFTKPQSQIQTTLM